MRIASIDDRFLNGLLQKQLARENDWLKGQYIRSILGASGNLTSVSTLLEEGLFTNIPSSSSSDVVEYKLQFGNHTTTYE
ncbi:MAG: hypothetical protein JJW01_02375 [Alphaproteobacteria bacterium]|nr:hypothetical protein [Rickettsiales bacterium]